MGTTTAVPEQAVASAADESKEPSDPGQMQQDAKTGKIAALPSEFKTIDTIRVYDLRLGIDSDQPGHNDRIIVFLPENFQDESLPCVLVSAGNVASRWLKNVRVRGRRFEGQAENRLCISLAFAGFAAIAYEIDGQDEFEEFRVAKGGLVNANNAINFAIDELGCDANPIYSFGFGYSGSRALYLAAMDKRIKAVAAIDPMISVGQNDPMGSVANSLMPTSCAAKIASPMRIWHGTGDRVFAIDESNLAGIAQLSPKTKNVLNDLRPIAGEKYPGHAEVKRLMGELTAMVANQPDRAIVLKFIVKWMRIKSVEKEAVVAYLRWATDEQIPEVMAMMKDVNAPDRELLCDILIQMQAREAILELMNTEGYTFVAMQARKGARELGISEQEMLDRCLKDLEGSPRFGKRVEIFNTLNSIDRNKVDQAKLEQAFTLADIKEK